LIFEESWRVGELESWKVGKLEREKGDRRQEQAGLPSQLRGVPASPFGR
jgi:hypothetical protein